MAVLFPVAVMGAIALIAWLTGAVDLTKTNWSKTAANLALVTLSTFLVAIVTEEGFFRGWLWGSLEKAGMKTGHVLVWSSIAFALWHISAVTLDRDFNPPAAQTDAQSRPKTRRRTGKIARLKKVDRDPYKLIEGELIVDGSRPTISIMPLSPQILI